MRLSAFILLLFIGSVPAHTQLSSKRHSKFDAQSVGNQRIPQKSMIVNPDFVKPPIKKLRMAASVSSDSQIKWEQLYGPFGSAVRCFVRAPNGAILFCSEGGIYRSKSLGGVWEKLVLPKSFNHSVIPTMFVHPSGTIIAGGNNQIFRSSDNGDTWNETDINAVFNQFAVDSSGNLYAASFDAGVLLSADTGRTWQAIGLRQRETGSLMITKTGKIICGSMNAIYTSIDQGASWDSAKVGYGPFFWLAQDSAGTIYAAADTYLFRSTDNGSTWRAIRATGTSMYRFYQDEEHSLYVLDANGIYRSRDAGTTWERLPVDNRLFLCMQIVNKDTLMAGSFDGVVTSIDAGKSWKTTDSGLVSLNIASITETRTGDLVVAAGRQIYKSTDQGRHWQSKYASQDLGAVLATDSDGNLYAADADYIRQSSDNGENWDNIILNTNSYYCTAMVVSAAKKLFVGSGNGRIYRRDEITKVWQTVFADSRGYAITALIIDNGGNLFGATASSVFKSADNGATWKEIFNSSKGWLVMTVYSTANYVFAGTYDDGFFRSADGGTTWERIASPSSEDAIRGMARNKDGTLYAAGMLDIYKSLDTGATWTSVGSGLPEGEKNNICITTKGELFVGTYSNGIYTSGVVTGVEDHQMSAKTFFLSQNYPNPFNPSTTISFTLPSRSFVSLKIFDMMGRVIATIVSEELPVGSYSRQWDASGMPSGVYFYRLQAGKYNETKRLLLLR